MIVEGMYLGARPIGRQTAFGVESRQSSLTHLKLASQRKFPMCLLPPLPFPTAAIESGSGVLSLPAAIEAVFHLHPGSTAGLLLPLDEHRPGCGKHPRLQSSGEPARRSMAAINPV